MYLTEDIKSFLSQQNSIIKCKVQIVMMYYQIIQHLIPTKYKLLEKNKVWITRCKKHGT